MIDGKLLNWRDVESQHEWSALLVGNGLSTHVWPRFAYRSLLGEIRDDGLTPADAALFATHGGTNFERVLADLRVAIRVGKALDVDVEPMRERYRSVQRALGRAVRKVHLGRDAVPAASLRGIREVLERQQWVFTTSYDLLIYWAIGLGGSYAPFVDLLWADGRCAFDPRSTDVGANRIPVYYLHGALHLRVGGDGTTVKLTWDARTLLDQFGEPVRGDPDARPLLVTEGSSHDKLLAIEQNAYLAHALDRLRRCQLPLVVFGSGLRAEDDHLLDALNENPDRPVAVSMLPGRHRDVTRMQADIYGRLHAEPLIFFDATTHPLGRDWLRIRRRGSVRRPGSALS